MSPYVTRAGWGARSPSGAGNAISAHPKGHAIHWEGPTMGTMAHSACAGVVRGIQDYHMDSQGWSDIAYNLMVCQHGTIYEGRGKGKGSAANGSSQANADWYAICALVGEDDPQPADLITGLQDAADMVRDWGAGSGSTGHRDHYNTACPGDALYSQVKAGTFLAGAPESEDEVMGDVSVTGISSDAAQVVSKAVWERYSPGGKNLATHLGEIGQNVAWLTEAIQAVAAKTGARLTDPPPPLPDAGGPAEDEDAQDEDTQ